MGELLKVIQLIQVAVMAGVDILSLTQKVSELIVKRHAEGKTLTDEDMKGLFDRGDKIEAAALKQYTDTLADPNTPKLT